MNSSVPNKIANTTVPFTANARVLREVLDALPNALFLLDASSSVVEPLNTAATRWTSASNPGAHAVPVSQVFPELSNAAISAAIALTTKVDSSAGRVLVRMTDPITAIQHDVELHFYPLSKESPARFIVEARTVGNSLSAEEHARRDALDDAFHDPLTRLANRRLFERRLKRAIDRASRSNYHFAVLFVDLDRFKEVNDRFGHLQGDHVLVAAAQRLVEAVRPQDMVARRDGDEFTILLDDLDHPEDAMHVAERIVERLQLPLSIDGPSATSVSIGASVGIAMASDGTLSADELIARADSAMYHAKALGGCTFVSLDRASETGGTSRGTEKPLPR
jgi:diguanylate cyclase (GGDEF)-like protein